MAIITPGQPETRSVRVTERIRVAAAELTLTAAIMSVYFLLRGIRPDNVEGSVSRSLTLIRVESRLGVFQEVRAVTGLGLKEAKDLVEGAPKEVKGGVNKDESAEIKKKLEAAGAKVEIK